MDIEKKRAFIIRTLYGLTWLMLGYILIKHVIPLISPFLLAFGIAWLLRIPTHYLSKHCRIPYRFSAVLMVIVFYGTVGTLICHMGVKLAFAFGNCVKNLPGIYATYVEPWLMDVLGSGNDCCCRQMRHFWETWIVSVTK